MAEAHSIGNVFGGECDSACFTRHHLILPCSTLLTARYIDFSHVTTATGNVKVADNSRTLALCFDGGTTCAGR